MKENVTFAEFFFGNPKTTRFWMRTLMFEMFPRFFEHSNMFKQNKPCYDVKISRVDMCFCRFL